MAASDPHTRPQDPHGDDLAPLGSLAVRERLDEEIARAERHGTHLSCLLVALDNLEQMASEHGQELHEQTLRYVAAALARELRRFDRVGRAGVASAHELLIVLPGADGPRGEVVARRALQRLRTIKIEAAGARLPLQVSVGLTHWREGASAEQMLAQARSALGGGGDALSPSTHAPSRASAAGAHAPHGHDGEAWALGSAGGH
ncbi:MAG TPA: diguanylate cyclase [Solirubrobacteraceae bacterium]|nr:diguanylate cyclase [Solirubrobacteraceae bacterium]